MDANLRKINDGLDELLKKTQHINRIMLKQDDIITTLLLNFRKRPNLVNPDVFAWFEHEVEQLKALKYE